MAEDGDEGITSTIKVYVALLLSVTFFLGVFGNLLNILTAALYKKINEKAVHILIVNMAICGIMVDILGVPVIGIYIIQDWPHWPFSKEMCSVSSFVTHTCMSTMVMTFVMIAVERYYATIKRQLIPIKFSIISLLLIWILSGSIHSTHVFDSLKVRDINSKNVTTCDQIGGNMINDDIKTTITTTTIISIVLMGISLSFLAFTGNHLRKLKKMKMPSSSKTFKFLLADFKLTFILTTLCFGFWLPKWSLTLLQRDTNQLKIKVMILSHIISLLSTIVTPVTCIMFSKAFRRSAKDFLTGCRLSTLRNINTQKKESIREPLSHRLILSKKDYEEIDTPPKFVKGRFKSGSHEHNMESISIDSNDLSPLHNSAKDNSSFTGSHELITEQTKDTRF